MRWIMAPLVIAAFAAGAACGEGKSGEALLVDALPAIVPQVEDIRQQFPDFAAQIGLTRSLFWSREGPTPKRPAEAPDCPYDLSTIPEAGRTYGYCVYYQVGRIEQFMPHCCASVAAAVDLYRDEASAQAALESRPPVVAGDPVSMGTVGDASVAWPQALFNDKPGCPCEVRFRVGRLLGRVSVMDVWFPPEGPVRREKALAELMATRMRRAQVLWESEFRG